MISNRLNRIERKRKPKQETDYTVIIYTADGRQYDTTKKQWVTQQQIDEQHYNTVVYICDNGRDPIE